MKLRCTISRSTIRSHPILKLDVSAETAIKPELRYQFERLGYCAPWPAVAERRRLDLDTQPGKLACEAEAPSPERRLIFNRTITLKDTSANEVRLMESKAPKVCPLGPMTRKNL